ncbi:hypothetical protein [Lysinibacillus capsici]|uniref:hypothetical protein n=1 Tax=Lysinibacillus capsici TaxID=2115968 RepID=UPI0034E1FA1A
MEVLQRVKGLLLLPSLEMATLKQVAEFYEVKLSVITMLVTNNRDELNADGYTVVKGKDLVTQNNWVTENMNGYILLENGYRLPYNKQGLFPKRAILCVGMLLRDSVVAKEVRTQLHSQKW